MTSVVRLVLQIIEGTNFHLLDHKSFLVVQGKLDGVSLKTDPVPLSSNNGPRLEIGEELVWKMSLRNFKRIRPSKALILDCFSVTSGGDSKSIGYIVINLKSVTDSSQSGWRRLLGSSGPSQTSPQLLLSVSLDDSSKPKKVEPKVMPLDRKVEELSGQPTELLLKNGITYIGSERFCKERFQFSCTILAASNLSSLAKSASAKVQLQLLKQTLETNVFDPSFALNKTFVFDVFSKTSTLVEYLNENPSVDVSLMHEDAVVAQAKHFLVLELGVPLTTEIVFSSQDIDIQPKVTVTFVVFPLEEHEFVKEAKKETVLVSPSPAFTSEAPLPLDDSMEIEMTSEFSKNFEVEEIEQEPTKARHENGPEPPVKRDRVEKVNTYRAREEISSVPLMSDAERMTKVVEELEDWKLKQKMLFTAEMNANKEELTRAWEDRLNERQRELEYEKIKALEKTKELSATLEEEIAKLKLKDKELDKEQEKLKIYKKQMEVNFEEQNQRFRSQVQDSGSKLSILAYQNKKLQEKVDLLENECSKLQKIQRSSESAEILELKEKLREMEQNLKRAQEEKAKITKEWVKSQRKVNEVKESNLTNINREPFFADQEKARLMKEKDSLEKMRLELLQMKQTPLQREVVDVRKLQEQREALLKTGLYNEQSALIKGLDEAISKAQRERASAD
ncbi:RNA-binding protein 25-like [Neocloeon triangulifer]|uniref:RNA-binding protein 25-like n=1 Tax=Neocloeon triangulifer TaxID=2078957 RepID=UPI00286F5C3B|nr:RNA-binding protein 25-like [Neocloeon triangulifer]